VKASSEKPTRQAEPDLVGDASTTSAEMHNLRAELTLTDEKLKSLYSQTQSASQVDKIAMLRTMEPVGKSGSSDPFAALHDSISREGNLYCPCCRTLLQHGTCREDVISDRFAALRFGSDSLYCPFCCDMVARDVCLDDPRGSCGPTSAYDCVTDPGLRSGPATLLPLGDCLKKPDAAETSKVTPLASELALAHLAEDAFATFDSEHARHGD